MSASPEVHESSDDHGVIGGGGVWGVDLGVEIEEAHRAACCAGKNTYADPQTGFQVFTGPSLLKQGRCCGNKCRHCPFGHYAVRPNAFMQRTSSLTALSDQSKLAISGTSTAPAVVLTTLFDPHSGQVLTPTSVPAALPVSNTPAADSDSAEPGSSSSSSSTNCGSAASGAAETLRCLPVSLRAVMDQSLALKRPLLAVPVEGCESLCRGDKVSVEGGAEQNAGENRSVDESGCGCKAGASAGGTNGRKEGAEAGEGAGSGSGSGPGAEREGAAAGGCEGVCVDGFTPNWASLVQAALESSLKSQIDSVVSPLPLSPSNSAAAAAAAAAATTASIALPGSGSSAFQISPVFDHQSLIRMKQDKLGSPQFRILLNEAGIWEQIPAKEAIARLIPSIPAPGTLGAASDAKVPRLAPSFVEIQAPAPASRFSRLR